MTHKLQDIAEFKMLADSSEPIVLCAADDHYVMPLAVMLHSAAQHLCSGAKMKAIVLDGGISDENRMALKESLANLPIDVFSIRPGLEDVETLAISHHITHTAYLRLLAGRLLPENIDRVIYLDSDTLICDDISELWNLPLNENFALAVPDVACPFIDVRYADCNFVRSNPYLAAISPVSNWKDLGLEPNSPYFNSGVMVLNVKRMREERIEQKLLACLEDNSEFVWCWDQYALNVVFANAWKPLPLKWNQGAHVYEFPNESHSPLNLEEFVEARDNPSIIHFTTEWKPWDYGNRHPMRDKYFEQLDQTAFAGWRPEKPGFSFAKSWQTLATQFVKQVVIGYRNSVGRIRRHRSTTPVDELPETSELVVQLDRDKPNKLPQSAPRLKKQLTIFSVPKPFVGAAKIAQTNAISSWQRMSDFADVVLLGDEEGTAGIAAELGVRHIPSIPTNEFGTPLLNAVFDRVQRETDTPYLAYCNCDIILFDDFEIAISRLITSDSFDQFVATGVRTNVKIDRVIDFQSANDLSHIRTKVETEGELESIVCKDYFVFTRSTFPTIPEFAVGRGNWDNWMIHSAKSRNVPVVALGKSVVAVHQEHGHQHAGGRLRSYATGAEARENQSLAGGRHLVSGSTSDYFLVDGRIVPTRLKAISGEFWFDFYRFTKLFWKFFGR